LLKPALSFLHQRRLLLFGFAFGTIRGHSCAPAVKEMLTSESGNMSFRTRCLLCCVDASELLLMSKRATPARKATTQQRVEV
jgi:hypothetical protein